MGGEKLARRIDEEPVKAVPKRLGVELLWADYDRRKGAFCPYCKSGEKAKVTNTLPWEGRARVRYHSCGQCGRTFKSMEGI
jgi:hypothetical protein